MKRLFQRTLPVLLAGLFVLGGGGAASAHVTVSPAEAPPGGDVTLTFSVPTESAAASTTRLAVYFPTATPLASVNVQPHPGWHYQVVTMRLGHPIDTDDGQVSEAVSRVTWTADSAASAIKPGEFDEFNVSAGPLPGGGTLTFKVLQTYSDAHVVRWIDESQPGQPEPERPAPTLTITSATSTPPGAPATSSASTSTTPLVLSIIALVVAVASLVLGLVRGRVLSRRRQA